MIARIRHGLTEAEKADEYLCETGVSDYRETEGSRGVYVPRGVEEDRTRSLMVSFWGSIEEAKSFAGPDPEKARYYPGDERALLEFEPAVEHYDVATGP